MRIFLLPITTRRVLIYCEKRTGPGPPSASGSSSSSSSTSSLWPPGPLATLPDRIAHRANLTWAGWEAAPSGGWRRALTRHGNRAFARIPFEEWGLKSLPALTAANRDAADAAAGTGTVEVRFPARFLAREEVMARLRAVATEREGLHRRRLWGSLFAMPLTLPMGLIPVVPNVPFFYLAFRAWSHYKAWYGGRWLAYVLEKGSLRPVEDGVLDGLYVRGLLGKVRGGKGKGKNARLSREEVERVVRDVEGRSRSGKEEVLLLTDKSGSLFAEEYGVPELQIEMERAVEQVSRERDDSKLRSSGVARSEKGKKPI